MKRKLTEWFGLTKVPFGKDITTKNLFSYPQLDELHQILELAVASRSGTLVTGEAGTGKTTAVRGFLDTLSVTHYRVIYLGNDQHGGALFSRLGAELGMRLSMARSQRMLQLTQHIRRHVAGSGKELVLVIDEAHLLDGRTLEDIRLLTNSEMDTRTDVILFMLGQLWLRSKLKNHGHAALYQRLRFRYGLEGLTKQQTKSYVQHHLGLCGCTKEVFTVDAMDYLFMASGGILREINNLTVDALLKATNLGKHRVDEQIIRMVVNQRDSA